MHANVDPSTVWTAHPPAEELARPAVPGPVTRTLLAFEFVALVEYWLAPLFFGVSDYAGLWSWMGYALFGLLVGTLVVGVLVPLRRHLQVAPGATARRWQLPTLWGTGLLAALFATGSLQFAGGGNALTVFQPTTIYSPFGAWPGLAFEIAPLHLVGSLNVASVALFGLLSALWSAGVLLGLGRIASRVALSPKSRAQWLPAVTAILFWAPLGFMTGCSYCTPLYISGLSTFAPGTALSAYDAIPLVPWIGLAGLLGISSLGAALLLLKEVTSRTDATESVLPPGA